MNHQSDPLEERLENLLVNIPFESLSEEECSYVLKSMTEKEYREYRMFLLKSKAVLREQPSPVPAPHPDLLRALHKRRTPSLIDRIIRLSSYRIPAWQAAIALLLLTFVFMMQPKADPSNSNQEPAYVQLVDSLNTETPASAAIPVSSKSRSFSNDRELADFMVEISAVPYQ